MHTIKNYLILLGIVLFATSLTACSDDDDTALSPTQGLVSFQFTKTTTYTLTALSDIYSIIVTVEKDGQSITLPSQILSGDENMISTPGVALEAGTYKVLAYKAFDFNGRLIDLLDITLGSDNDMLIKAGEATAFVMPVKIKTPISISNYYNILYALCLEGIGEDKSMWPKSWDFENGYIDDTWAGLEFETDDYGLLVSLSGIVFNGEPLHNFEDNEGTENHGLTEFKHMKKLPAAIANLSSLTSIIIRNCDVEELPEELKNTNIQTLHIEGTKLKKLPEALGDMKHLTNVFLKDNALTDFPEQLTRIENMYDFSIVNERISSVPESIKNWKSLRTLRLRGMDITSLPDVFNDVYRISTLDLQDNKQLSTLPASIKDTKIPYDNGLYTKKTLRGLLLDGCAFTRIPDEVQHENIKMLSLADNRITNITQAEIERMSNLHTLILDRNPLTAFPKLTSNSLGMLSLIGCGFERTDIDLSGLPNLMPTYLFLTQEEYDHVLGPNWDLLKNE